MGHLEQIKQLNRMLLAEMPQYRKQAEAFEINFNIDTDMKKGDFMTTRPAGKCC